MWNKKIIKRTAAICLVLMMIIPQTVMAASGYEKNETVRVKTTASGKVRKITVEDWLKISTKRGSIKDSSSLKGIINKDGDEEFRKKGNRLVWENRGEDITYQGSCDRELPVDVRITYYLNGEKVSAGEIAGKSGNVKIRFDYTNTALVNAGEKRVHVPFLCATGLVLPSDIFSGIKVTNGKLMEDRQQSMVIGTAAPGLSSELNLSDMKDLPLKDWFEVEAKARKFELEFTATIVSTVGLDEMDDVNDAASLSGALSSFTNATSKLLKGSRYLSGGMDTMSKYLASYFNGVKELDGAITKLNDSLKTMTVQKKALDSKISSIEKKLDEYEKTLKNAKDSEDAENIETLVKKIIGETKDAYEYREELKAKVDELDEFIKKAKAYRDAVEEYRDSMKADVSAIDIDSIQQKTSEMEELIGSMEGLSEEQKQTLLDKTGEIKSSADSAKTARQTALDNIDSKMPVLDIPEAEPIDTGKLEVIIETLKQEQALMDKYDSFLSRYGSADELIDDMSKTVEKAKSLTSAVNSASGSIDMIYKATKTLKKGSNVLSSMNPQLIGGVNGLNKGMDGLETGIEAFDRGARKLGSLKGTGLAGALSGFKNLQKAEGQYCNYSGIRSGVKGSVVFIYESDEIEAE